MKKIPTLFERKFVNNKIVEVIPNVPDDLLWVLKGEGEATVKWDGSCCAIIDGVFMKRYDAKHGKPIPFDAIKCQPKADPVTGHLPCWIPCKREDAADKWFWEAYDNTKFLKDGTYEAIGPHFQNNPYHLEIDILKSHGTDVIYVDRTFESIRDYLEKHEIEGIVFWKDGEPKCKIKRSDFAFDWGKKSRL